MKLGTVQSFDKPIDLHFAQIKVVKLRHSPFFFDEHIVILNSLYSNSAEGIKL